MNTTKINGFDIIAHSHVDHGIRQEIVILGHRAHADHAHEYVVTSVSSLADTSWGQGHYMHSLTRAVQAYADRGGK